VIASSAHYSVCLIIDGEAARQLGVWDLALETQLMFSFLPVSQFHRDSSTSSLLVNEETGEWTSSAAGTTDFSI